MITGAAIAEAVGVLKHGAGWRVFVDDRVVFSGRDRLYVECLVSGLLMQRGLPGKAAAREAQQLVAKGGISIDATRHGR